VIVDDCERSIFIPSAIKAVNEPIFSATETIVPGTPAITFGAQTIIPSEPQNPLNA